MNYIFCTLFDSGYLSRGLALYYSLESYCKKFHLYIFAFDNIIYEILIGLKLKSATIISLSEFEDKQLLQVKQSRNRAEYCWTSTSSTILYCLVNFDIDHCTYLDADLYFFSSPQPIFEEIGNASIALTKHNYTKIYDQSLTSGMYCVQFVYFKNDKEGLNALKWWRNSCIDWCYARLENGKFGDQKYLDDWTERFSNVHIITHLGAGVAPWNIQQYVLLNYDTLPLQYLEKKNNKYFSLIFYHFHNLRFNVKNNLAVVEPSKFNLSFIDQEKLYVPYINRLLKIEESLKNYNKNDNYIILFKKNIFILKIYLMLRLFLKKFTLFQQINSFLNKSSRS